MLFIAVLIAVAFYLKCVVQIKMNGPVYDAYEHSSTKFVG